MATTPPAPQKKGTSFPPKRGQVKAQIFDSFVKSVVSAASKAGEFIGKITRNDGKGGGSASSTAPPSSYNSEGNSDVS